VTFAAWRLDDARGEEGIRWYSGGRVSRPSICGRQAPALEIDLGNVQSIARLRLNGREIATLWKSALPCRYCLCRSLGQELAGDRSRQHVAEPVLGDRSARRGQRVTAATTKNLGWRPAPLRPARPVTIRSAETVVIPKTIMSSGNE